MSANTTEPTQPVTRKPSQKKGKRKVSPKKDRTAKQAIPLVISKHGLEMRYARGDVQMDPKATEPDNPNALISRAKRTPSYVKAYTRGSIDEFQREAADKYLVLYERLYAGLPSSSAMCSGDAAGGKAFWDKLPPSEAQAQAVEQLSEVENVLGANGTRLMRMFVIQDMDAKDIALAFGMIPHKAMGAIEVTLTRMSEHWQLARKIVGKASRIR